MDQASGVLTSNEKVQRSAQAPRLRLLVELEPARRVFFRNLADLISFRPVPRVVTTSKPGRFWDDVFVPSSPPWASFLESMLWHLLLVVLVVWAQSRVWVPLKQFPEREAFHKSITYYPPKSFSTAGSRTSAVRKQSQGKRAQAHQPAIPVTPQRKPSLVTPPDIKQATARLPNFLGSQSVTPMVPFSATTNLRHSALAGSSAVVAPPPQVDQATGRRLALPQPSVVPPVPDLGAASERRTGAGLNAGGSRVVPPPPSVQGVGDPAASSRMGRLAHTGSRVVPPPPSVQALGSPAGNDRVGSLSGAGPQVVPPPPSVLGAGNPAGRSRVSSLSGNGSQVVPPPPTVLGAGSSAGSGRISSASVGGSQVVPPAPSIQGTGNSAGSGRLGSLSGNGARVVPPPPSVQGAGNSGGSGRPNSLLGNSSQVVPPAPSVQGGGNSAKGGGLSSLSNRGLSSLSNGGAQAVPPPPSVEGAGNTAGSGRMGSLSNDGSQVLPPPPSGEGAGSSATAPPATPTDSDPAVASTAASAIQNKPPAEELSLGSIGLVFALPGSSYFSNYEVFVAQRRLGGNQIQLIKLVYEFLPYQRRLSEYDFTNLRQRRKLVAIPDGTCNETLGQMIQVQADPARPAAGYANLPAELRSADLNAVLPCYRTTADDFQRAFSQIH